MRIYLISVIIIVAGCASQSSPVEGVPSANSKANSRGRDMTSPFESTVSGITIPNTHQVAPTHFVLRGQRPRSAIEAMELEKFGVKRILIFRNESPGESSFAEEKAFLNEAGFDKKQVSTIEFRWKDIKGFRIPCRQTLDALKLLEQAEASKETIFFHCTLGEDRTGYLSAVYRMLRDAEKPASAFRDDMCRWGYAEGDPDKAPAISKIISANITPIFVKMSYLIHSGKLSWTKRDKKVCDAKIPSKELAAFEASLKSEANDFVCKSSIL